MRHVAVMARAPSSGGKTRLTAGLPAARAAALRRALLGDTLDAVRTSLMPHTLFFTPASARTEMAALAGPGASVCAQVDGDLGTRMQAAFVTLFERGAATVVLIGSDLPALAGAVLGQACDRLEKGSDVVLGPAADGGYYLIGLRQPRASLFQGLSWGAPDVFERTRVLARAAGLRTDVVAPCYDVDRSEDLDRLARGGAPAPRTRAWLAGGGSARQE